MQYRHYILYALSFLIVSFSIFLLPYLQKSTPWQESSATLVKAEATLEDPKQKVCDSCLLEWCYFNNDSDMFNSLDDCYSTRCSYGRNQCTNTQIETFKFNRELVEKGEKQARSKDADSAYPIPQTIPQVTNNIYCSNCLSLNDRLGLFPYTARKTCVAEGSCVVIGTEDRPEPGFTQEEIDANAQALDNLKNSNQTSSGPSISTTKPYSGFGVFNIGSCGNIDDPQKGELVCVVQKATSMLLAITGAIVVVMIIISGIAYMTSMGNPTQTAWAKKSLVGAIIGLIIVVMAYSIVKLLTILLT